MSAGMILTVRDLSFDADLVKHKVLREHILNIVINLSYGIYIACHASFAKIPFTKDAESSVPYFLASSTASLMDTATGMSSS